MFRRQLTALDYPSPDTAIDLSDPQQFANLVLWLEDMRICAYAIDDRAPLRQIAATAESRAAWDTAFAQYRRDVQMPDSISAATEQIAWLIGHAVQLSYLDSSSSYADISAQQVTEKQQQQQSAAPTVQSSDPLDALDQSSPAFRAGVAQLVRQLQIAQHPDHVVQLQAAARLIHQKLRPDVLGEQPPHGVAYPLKEAPRCAFDDRDVDEAAKILRLLQIHHVRELQTEVNETIVAVQELTADPKTDSKLGKVGVK